MTDHRPSPTRTVGYTAFTPGQKAVTIVAILGLALGGLLFAVWAARPTDAPQAGDPANQTPSAAAPQSAGIDAALTGADARTVAYQNRLNASLQKMLDSVVGPGHSAVTTTTELDLDEVATTARTYTSNPTVAALAESMRSTGMQIPPADTPIVSTAPDTAAERLAESSGCSPPS